MLLLKQKFIKNLGFTLIELIVVIALFVILATLLLANYNGTRAARNLKIAQNQMVTNIRKAQSYILSSRNINGTAPKFYVMKFDINASQYYIQSVDANYSLNTTLETISLPVNVTISAIQDTNTANVTNSRPTVQVAYGAPYAKMYTYTSGDCLNISGINFVLALQTPTCLFSLTDRKITVTLQTAGSSATKTVTIYGTTGKVEGN